MNLTKTRIVKITLLAATFFFAAFRAHAEGLTFDLPVQAHWGSVILPAGEYAISVPLAKSWPQQISVTHKGKLVVSLFPMTESTTTQSTDSYLRLVSVGDTFFVREYNLGSTGKQFTFSVPKGATYKVTVKPKAKAEAAASTRVTN